MKAESPVYKKGNTESLTVIFMNVTGIYCLMKESRPKLREICTQSSGKVHKQNEVGVIVHEFYGSIYRGNLTEKGKSWENSGAVL